MSTSKTIITDQLKTSRIRLSKGTNLTFIALLKKGWEEKQFINFDLESEESSVTFLAFILGKADNKFPFETISNHTVPNTKAYYYVRCALFDNSQVDYKGNLIIKPTAQLTDSYLSHHTLMLSKNAKTQTIPSLEIEADDVKAGHSATIGKVDEELLFYLESRGIDKPTGENLLIKSFMRADLKKIPDEKIRKLIEKEIEKSLQC